MIAPAHTSAWLFFLLTAFPLPTSLPAQPTDPPSSNPDFHTQILPLLTRSGCNAGACHGAAAGRGEFRLSLFAADPAADFQAIAIERQSRRINLAHPQLSLIFKKACGQIPHEGGQVLDPDGSEARLLLQWIHNGALPGTPRKLTALKIEPAKFIASTAPASTPIRVSGVFNDGTSQNVTSYCRITATDTSALTVSDADIVSVLRPGRHHLVVRYLDQTQLVEFSIPFTKPESSRPARSNALPGDAASTSSGLVDRYIQQTLSQSGLEAASPASPETWIRRLYLQLAGKLPPPELVREIIDRDSPALRTKILDELLDSEDFTDFWTLQLASLLQLHSLPGEPQAWNAAVGWLRKAVATDVPLNQFASQLLLATGDSHIDGAAGFSRMAADARAHAELIGQSLAGFSLGCANCHNHPLDRWTQDDFHGFAAIFAPLDRGRFVQFTGRGSVTNLRTGEPAVPRIPGQQNLNEDADHRPAVVTWLTSGPTPPLARNLANRFWKHFFGRGLVEPVNDLSLTNPASHPELLDALAAQLVADGWSLRRSLRLIVLSDTWSRTSGSPTAEDSSLQNAETLFLARRTPLPFTPQLLADAIADVCGVPLDLAPQEARRAVQVLDSSRTAADLDQLGRCRHPGGCSSEAANPRLPLAAQLHLLNGTLINQRISAPQGRLQQLLSQKSSDSEIVHEFILRALNRLPTADEQEYWQQHLATSDQAEQLLRLEDFLWSLLNSQEFRYIP